MREFNGIAELEAAIGENVGTSDWTEITQESVNLFAEATGDHQWIHVDPEKAKDGPFGGTIVHGFLTLSLLPKFGWEIYTVSGMAMMINYGLNKVRFPAVVPVGSKVRASITLDKLEQKSSGYQLTTTTTVEAEGVERPVCIAESLMMLVPEQ
ncbi:MaoC family dehydratase [Dietzia timorensis]|uniref:Putative enoyl-CoA hydratase 1 n=1 Tax=Dietzia timorensis TaxID=499555 RepID=A0A173LP86_9ACTN|nr:MaoC family dehydratase [Dietzia timorensis]ANI93321.1 putative enoyl-CoA hydratase 1 [Dietzia timorensis]